MRVKAPAKLNLGLKILGKLPDGFHELDTVFARISLCDELELVLRNDGKIKVEVIGEKISLRENLVYKAAMLLKKFTSKQNGISITLMKKIPSGAGLGGGSSDSAATLKALNRLWGLKLKRIELEKLALELGSDVPFFLRSGIQRGQGRGELLTRYELPKSFPRHVVLIVPKVRVSTAWAYGQLSITNFQFSIVKRSFSLSNDFEEVVFQKYPELKQLKKQLKRSGAKYTSLSGSGSAVFGLFQDQPQVEQLEELGEVVVCRLLV